MVIFLTFVVRKHKYLKLWRTSLALETLHDRFAYRQAVAVRRETFRRWRDVFVKQLAMKV